MGRRPSAVRTLGEVALRVRDLKRMKRFTQVLALFDGSVSVSSELTTIDHIAFTIDLGDYESERRRLEDLGLDVEVTDHAWVKWRSLYFHDPEGNQVELVCHDPDLS